MQTRRIGEIHLRARHSTHAHPYQSEFATAQSLLNRLLTLHLDTLVRLSARAYPVQHFCACWGLHLVRALLVRACTSLELPKMPPGTNPSEHRWMRAHARVSVIPIQGLRPLGVALRGPADQQGPSCCRRAQLGRDPKNFLVPGVLSGQMHLSRELRAFADAYVHL